MKTLIVILCGFAFLVGNHCLLVQRDDLDVDICARIPSRFDLNLDEISGKWYGEEIDVHDGVSMGELEDVCVVVNIAEIKQQATTFRLRYHHLRISWQENGNSIEYMSSYNISRPGLWLPLNHDEDSNHRLFSGTVVASQAVRDHLVLTFCERDPRRKLVSIIVSRQPNTLSKEDIQEIRSVLKRRGLKIQSIHKICGNSAAVVALSITMLIVGAIFSINWNKYY